RKLDSSISADFFLNQSATLIVSPYKLTRGDCKDLPIGLKAAICLERVERLHDVMTLVRSVTHGTELRLSVSMPIRPASQLQGTRQQLRGNRRLRFIQRVSVDLSDRRRPLRPITFDALYGLRQISLVIETAFVDLWNVLTVLERILMFSSFSLLT